MPNYQNGKIYKITSSHTDLCYIGSTCEKYLSSRLGGHKTHMKRWKDGKRNYTSSFEIVKYEDAKIELIELFPCNIIEELTKREGEIIKQYGDKCVNRRVEGRTKKQHYQDNKDKLREKSKQYYLDNTEKEKERHKQYYLDNKDKINETHRQYQLDNKDKILERKKQYYQDNKDKILERHKQYYLDNKDKINEKHKCECGCK